MSLITEFVSAFPDFKLEKDGLLTSDSLMLFMLFMPSMYDENYNIKSIYTLCTRCKSTIIQEIASLNEHKEKLACSYKKEFTVIQNYFKEHHEKEQYKERVLDIVRTDNRKNQSEINEIIDSYTEALKIFDNLGDNNKYIMRILRTIYGIMYKNKSSVFENSYFKRYIKSHDTKCLSTLLENTDNTKNYEYLYDENPITMKINLEIILFDILDSAKSSIIENLIIDNLIIEN
jgi:hypothetical protein